MQRALENYLFISQLQGNFRGHMHNQGTANFVVIQKFRHCTAHTRPHKQRKTRKNLGTMESEKRSASGLDVDSGYTSLSTPNETGSWARRSVGKPAHALDPLSPAEIHAAAAAVRAHVSTSKPLLRFNAITLQVRHC